MVSACPFACPRAELRSLPPGSPATRLGTVSPSAKSRTGGSADLMNFYATSYAVAHGQPRFRPCLGHHTGTGYVANNNSAVSLLLRPRSAAEGYVPLLRGGIEGGGTFWGHSGTATLVSPHSHGQEAATSTTTEHFQPFWLLDGRNPLPRHVHQAGSGYLQGSSLSCLRTGAVSPPRTRLLRGPPKASREHGTGSHHAGPAQPDILQKTTIGTEERSGFTRATARRDSILPALPRQPVSPYPTTS
ncbi:PPR32 phosphatase, partial [Pluvianellus socialis]|nr:PPR32 phosphatase [Pluvianellus socialis]